MSSLSEDELDKKLRQLASERKQSLDDGFADSDKTKQRIKEARAAQAEEDSIDRARVRGSAEAAARGKNSPDMVSSPSFLNQALSAGEQQEREEQALIADAKKPRGSMEGLEIDPRGFVVPRVGDIVLCPGKWASQDMVGLVTSTQFVDSRTSWNVDVMELSQVGPRTYGKTFNPWKKPRQTWFDVSEVRPARAEYVEEQDAWRVDNARDLYAAGGAPVDEEKRSVGLQEYQELKQKLLLDTAVLGVVGSVALGFVDGGLQTSYAVGSASAMAYVFLISRQVDDVGAGSGISILSPRLLAPIGLMIALYLKASAAGGGAAGAGAGAFPQLPPKEIAAAVIGFLTYKLPLLYESSRQVLMTIDEASEGLEQGVNEGYKQWQTRVKDRVREARVRESDPSTTWNPFTKIRLTVTRNIEEERAAAAAARRADGGEDEDDAPPPPPAGK